MKKTLHKNIRREFQFSFSRFLSVTLLLALGVFVLVGLKSTGPDMRMNANHYYQQHHLADAQLTSNFPLSKTDRKQIQTQLQQHHGQRWAAVQQQDGLITTGSSPQVIRIQNFTTNLAQVHLCQGHLPRQNNQLVLNVRDQHRYHLGQWLNIKFTSNHNAYNNLPKQRWQIVGFVTSSDYLDKSQLGVTPLHHGRVQTFGYVRRQAFVHWQPTIIKINFKLQLRKAYNQSYEQQNQKYVDRLQPLVNRLAAAKTQRIRQHWQAIYQHQLQQMQSLNPNNPAAVFQAPQLLQLQQRIAHLPSVSYTIQTRNDYDYGYRTFGEEAQRIDILSRVFPYVFFLVALIVCFTTMSRMASEKRTELGILTGLGYSKPAAVEVFLVYGFLSGLLGSILGAYLGTKFLAVKIYQAYSANYALPDLWARPAWNWILIAGTIALMVAIVPPLFVAFRELQENVADLLQPLVPTKGGKIFLEKWTGFWQRLSFKYQIALRNIFRYQMRMLMTIIGIFGCTALLITGFGIRDSLTGIVATQYQKLIHYDAVALLSPQINSEQQLAYQKKVRQHHDVRQTQLINYQTVYVRSPKNAVNQEVTAIAAPTYHQLNHFITLKNPQQQPLNLQKLSGIVVTQKLAAAQHVEVGDQLKFQDQLGHHLHGRVAAISQMYAGHFIFLAGTQYRKIWQQPLTANALMIKNRQRSSIPLDHLATWLNHQSATQGVIRSDTIKDAVNYILDGLNNLILIIIICSSLLALVVLYTLTNINVDERKRELATMKVLGFSQTEVVMSIFRETLFLTGIGILLGFVGGYGLHHYIMQTLPPQNVMVLLRLKPTNFLISTLMTFLFAIIVMLIMAYKIQKVDMLAALKETD